jgi:alpha-ribazole phosphatase
MNATLTVLRHPRPRVPSGVCYGRMDCAAEDDHERALRDELLRTLRPQRVVSSPALRCRGLARRLCDVWQCACEIEPRVQEMDFARWEGRSWDAVPRNELDAWARRPLDHAPGGGESLRDMAQRVRAWVLEITACRTDLLVVTHGGVMRLLAAWNRGAPLASVLELPAPAFGQRLSFPLERFVADRQWHD